MQSVLLAGVAVLPHSGGTTGRGLADSSPRPSTPAGMPFDRLALVPEAVMPSSVS
jgi:hypothetical protein